MGITEFFNKLKEDNKNFLETTKRINSSGFCGNVNRNVKDGDFNFGSYISIIDHQGVIYGASQDDYCFDGDDIASFELEPNMNITVNHAKEQQAALRYIITFKDGKVAQADLMLDKIDAFKKELNLD